jgi:hypothetical protein
MRINVLKSIVNMALVFKLVNLFNEKYVVI